MNSRASGQLATDHQAGPEAGHGQHGGTVQGVAQVLGEPGVGHRVGCGQVDRPRHRVGQEPDDGLDLVVEGDPAPPLAPGPEPTAQPQLEQGQELGQGATVGGQDHARCGWWPPGCRRRPPGWPPPPRPRTARPGSRRRARSPRSAPRRPDRRSSRRPSRSPAPPGLASKPARVVASSSVLRVRLSTTTPLALVGPALRRRCRRRPGAPRPSTPVQAGGVDGAGVGIPADGRFAGRRPAGAPRPPRRGRRAAGGEPGRCR